MKNTCAIIILCIIFIWSFFIIKDRSLHQIYRIGEFVSPRSFERTGEYVYEEEMSSFKAQQEEITFDDIMIFVRTTTQNSEKRMPSLLESWLPDAFKRISSLFVLSDGDDPKVSERIPAGHFINSKCGITHSKQDLWCKTSKELSIFAETDKKWYCLFDDDNYLNIDNLLKLLRGYDSNGLWYIGRRPESKPRYIPETKEKNVKIWFHNLGAGICLSRGLTDKMNPIIRNDGFAKMAPSIGHHDDLVLGFIINHLLRINFTESYFFHSQWENMTLIRDLEKQITLSYREKNNNYLNVDGFKKDEDPFRFRSLHCKIHPEEDMCRILLDKRLA